MRRWDFAISFQRGKNHHDKNIRFYPFSRIHEHQSNLKTYPVLSTSIWRKEKGVVIVRIRRINCHYLDMCLAGDKVLCLMRTRAATSRPPFGGARFPSLKGQFKWVYGLCLKGIVLPSHIVPDEFRVLLIKT